MGGRGGYPPPPPAVVIHHRPTPLLAQNGGRIGGVWSGGPCDHPNPSAGADYLQPQSFSLALPSGTIHVEVPDVVPSPKILLSYSENIEVKPKQGTIMDRSNLRGLPINRSHFCIMTQSQTDLVFKKKPVQNDPTSCGVTRHVNRRLAKNWGGLPETGWCGPTL